MHEQGEKPEQVIFKLKIIISRFQPCYHLNANRYLYTMIRRIFQNREEYRTGRQTSWFERKFCYFSSCDLISCYRIRECIKSRGILIFLMTLSQFLLHHKTKFKFFRVTTFYLQTINLTFIDQFRDFQHVRISRL